LYVPESRWDSADPRPDSLLVHMPDMSFDQAMRRIAPSQQEKAQNHVARPHDTLYHASIRPVRGNLENNLDHIPAKDIFLLLPQFGKKYDQNSARNISMW
jgi:hypothetical protein